MKIKNKPKYIAFFLICIFFSLVAKAQFNTAQLLNELETTLQKKEHFQKKKQNKIRDLKKELEFSLKANNQLKAYTLSHHLYSEYRSFIYDSAFFYVKKMLLMAYSLKNKDLIYKSKIELGFTFLSSGLFKESLDSLKSIPANELSNSSKIEFYKVYARTYFDLADYHKDNYYSPRYNKLGTAILDSALLLLNDKTPEFWLAYALKQMKSENLQNALEAFNLVISQYQISEHDYAICTSSLGWIYTLLDRENDAVEMLIKAAIADVKSSTKETVAIRNLAVLLFKRGDIEKAYKYIKIALADATFYNARFRKIEISEALPIIESEHSKSIQQKQNQLVIYAFITTVLVLLITLFLVVIYKQLMKLKRIKTILQNTNQQLQNMNESLRESNKIKLEYIGYFFNVSSDFIVQLDSISKTINRKILAKQFDDLKNMLNKTYLNKEREKLFENFDRIFLKIFPNFIEKFNELFNPEDRVELKEDGLLTTDLRIYALIRLGITDNEKIAKFLNYSVNTIYTYKTKLKNKTIVEKDKFRQYILAIKAV